MVVVDTATPQSPEAELDPDPKPAPEPVPLPSPLPELPWLKPVGDDKLVLAAKTGVPLPLPLPIPPTAVLDA